MSCDACSCCTPPALLAYQAKTERLVALTAFLARFAPAIGERSEASGVDVDDEAAPEVREVRDEAIGDAFRAVALIAADSPVVQWYEDPDPDPDDGLPLPANVAYAAAS